MKIELLEDFIHVAKRQNITRSAAEMHTSQPSLSMRIAALEKEVGCPLFSRSNAGLELTASGRIFLEYAQRIVGLYDEGVEKCRRARRSVPVKIAIDPSTRLVKALAGAGDIAYTIVDLDINTFAPDAVAHGAVDIAASSDYTLVEECRAEAERRGLTYLPIGSSPSFVAMMADHPLAAKPALARADFDGRTVVVNSGAYFDHYARLVQRMVGEEYRMEFRVKPSASYSDAALADFEDALYVCGSPTSRSILGQRPDVVVRDELDGEPLLFPVALVCRTADYRDEHGPVGALVRRLAAALG